MFGQFKGAVTTLSATLTQGADHKLIGHKRVVAPGQVPVHITGNKFLSTQVSFNSS